MSTDHAAFGPIRRCALMRILILPLGLLVAGFAFVPPHAELAAPSPAFKAEQFFAGRTVGKGVIKSAFKPRASLSVESVGRVESDGTLVLDQRVERTGKPAEQRQWRIRKLAGGRYSGTLTGALGPVTGEVKGNCLHLRYKMKKGGFQASQYIYLQPGGRTALNRMSIHKLGVRVATVEETIRRAG